ncbi:MAG: hypothetical protein M1608_11160 [Candidatus Omnitrophica bacterium]|nr:hypothetical protein [Candidatus Omnitrophota bacterium]
MTRDFLSVVLLSGTIGLTWAVPAENTFAAAPAPENKADFYVAPDGKDSNPGNAAAPFATIAKARDAVREKVAAGLTNNVLVLIRGGLLVGL